MELHAHALIEGVCESREKDIFVAFIKYFFVALLRYFSIIYLSFWNELSYPKRGAYYVSRMKSHDVERGNFPNREF